MSSIPATWVYPQLEPLEASHLYEQLQAGTLKPTTRCAAAVPSPTGMLVPEEHLHQVRDAVLTALGPINVGAVSRPDVAEWDRLVGDALHATMGIVPADAAREGVWSFMTLVLLPDIAALRFPDLHRDRILGRPRNVFRRVWWRREMLGDLPIPDGVRPLGEDEYVNIFERAHLSRCRPLTRALAATILEYRATDRSNFARDLTKTVRRLTGPLLLDVLSEAELRELVYREAVKLGAQLSIVHAEHPAPKPPPPEHRRGAPSLPIDPRRKRLPAPVPEPALSDTGRTVRTRTFYSESISDLVHDGRLPVGAILVGRYRGIDHTVTVEPDGTLNSGSGRHMTPSEACRALTGQETISGWGFWTFNQVPIGQLRRV